ncbi:transposase [Sulfuriferula sp.]|uniref:transposase n=1 Tax=Sulfuriferula sp. TaxID=2025307 RepID=UPI00272F8E05|nr:transposase [Sulfuriferula sp.]MDP2027316.1 transposase [Sulfuriferula sp.]
MPRLSRAVFAGIPHHITQRGNRREDIFFTDGDREAYLAWLWKYCDKYEVEILAYCLMTHHIHLVAVPAGDDGLQRVLKPLHMRYAQRINRARGWTGHLWQGRFFSSPLDDAYLWAAVRYVERNPVRAEMTRRVEDYHWSSAAAHCGIRLDRLLNQASNWSKQFSAIEDWSAWLLEGDEPEEMQMLRRNVDKGLPCGSEGFVKKLGKQAGCLLEYRAQGRPKKGNDDE